MKLLVEMTDDEYQQFRQYKNYAETVEKHSRATVSNLCQEIVDCFGVVQFSDSHLDPLMEPTFDIVVTNREKAYNLIQTSKSQLRK